MSMTMYHHQFRGRFPRIHWRLVREPDGVVITTGTARTKNQAQNDAIDAIPRHHSEEIIALFDLVPSTWGTPTRRPSS